MLALSPLDPNATALANHGSERMSTQGIVALTIIGTAILIGSLFWCIFELPYILTTLLAPFPSVLPGSLGSHFARATSLARWFDEYSGFKVIPFCERAGAWIWRIFRGDRRWRSRSSGGDEDSMPPAHGRLHSIVFLALATPAAGMRQTLGQGQRGVRHSGGDEESMQPAHGGLHSAALRTGDPSIPRSAFFPPGLSGGGP